MRGVEYHREIEQGSREWWALRLGTPTASRFSRILTPRTLEVSSGLPTFAAELLAERILGRPLSDEDEYFSGSMWTEYGTSVEKDARIWYQMYREIEVERCGFIDQELVPGFRVGYSPDGLVGEDGLVEIKCRGAKYHMTSVLGVGEIADRMQVQGGLWVSRRKWIDVVAFNHHLPKRIERHYPEPSVQTALTEGFDELLELMRNGEEVLAKQGDVIEVDHRERQELLEQLEASVNAQ